MDPKTLGLMRQSVLVVDDKHPEEAGLNLSHFWALEDRETGDIVIAGARYSANYKESHPHLWRMGVQ